MTDYKVEFNLEGYTFMSTTFEEDVFEELREDGEHLLETEESYGKFHERVFDYDIKRLEEINSYELMKSLFESNPKKGYSFLIDQRASEIDDLLEEKHRENGKLSESQKEEIIENQIDLDEDLGSFKRKELVENVDVKYKQN